MRVYTAATARGNPTFGWFTVGVPCIATSLRRNPTFGWFNLVGSTPHMRVDTATAQCNPTFEWPNDSQLEVGITTAT